MTADYSDILRRSLFQLGDWHIVRSRLNPPVNFAKPYAIHTNCAPVKWDATTISVKNNKCFRCGDAVPDELQALVTLYHWET